MPILTIFSQCIYVFLSVCVCCWIDVFTASHASCVCVLLDCFVYGVSRFVCVCVCVCVPVCNARVRAHLPMCFLFSSFSSQTLQYCNHSSPGVFIERRV